jgi:hypothetical protein
MQLIWKDETETTNRMRGLISGGKEQGTARPARGRDRGPTRVIDSPHR